MISIAIANLAYCFQALLLGLSTYFIANYIYNLCYRSLFWAIPGG